MKRRTAIGGILGLAGIGYASFTGIKYFIEDSNKERGKLKAYESLITELVEVIIPTTTASPGAKDAKVQVYVINYMEDCSTNKEYNNFLNGLKDLQEDCMNTHSNTFEDCSPIQKTELLENLDNNWASKGILLKLNNKLLGRSFFNILKSLTIEGYCTSQIGVTKHLAYNPMPGKYNAITKLTMNQKSWATK